MTSKIRLKLTLLLIAFLVVLIFGIAIGSSNITFFETIKILLSKIFNTPIEGIDDKMVTIVMSLRVPRVLVAAIVGSSLALSGLALQSLLGNPIASPYTLGVSTGASIGVAIAIVTGFTLPFLPSMTFPFMGFVFAFLAVIIILTLTSVFDKNFSSMTIVLVGMVVSLTLNGVLTLLIVFAKENANSIIFWQMGSFSLASYQQLFIVLPFFIIGSVLLGFKYLELDALSLGETEAKLSGVEVKSVKYKIIILTTLLTGAAVSITGIVGFIGLIAPHIARRLFGEKHFYLIPSSMLIGSMLLIIADTVARTIMSPTELPVGAITALIGGPFFAYVFFKKR